MPNGATSPVPHAAVTFKISTYPSSTRPTLTTGAS